MFAMLGAILDATGNNGPIFLAQFGVAGWVGNCTLCYVCVGGMCVGGMCKGGMCRWYVCRWYVCR